MSKPRLTRADFTKAACSLGCDIAMVQAVARVESLGGGFLSNDQPKVLFERHWFHNFTKGVFDKTHPSVSNSKPGGYVGGIAEHGRIVEASTLDRNAALKSTSWGMFQIMGFNHVLCGYSTLQAFINAMYNSEADQLTAFVAFIKSKKLDVKMINLEFASFARGYNGGNYAINRYDSKIREAYITFGGVL